MRRFFTILLMVGLFAVAVCCATAGYRNYRLFILSHGAAEAAIRLDTPGTFAVTVDPPGRSLFRPGGVLEIFLSRAGIPREVQSVTVGRGSLRVTDRMGHLCLEQQLGDLGVTYLRGRQYYSLIRQFDTSRGGPYRVDFEITEPFRGLDGTLQTLSARHFT